MIACLKGTIQYKQEQSIILNLGQIGFEIFLDAIDLSSVKKNQELEFFIYHHITDRNQMLYGFRTIEKLEFFKSLLSVSGIGPKGALRILAKAETADLICAINQNNPKFLIKLGINSKTSERLILELKNKIFNKVGGVNKFLKPTSDQPVGYDLISALESLGYKKNKILECLPQIPESAKSLEEKIKFAFKWLST